MQQQITRGDYLKDLITIYIENNLQQSLDDLYSMFVFQCGKIQKQLTPAQVIKISFTEQESQLLTNYNTCYLAGITADGHKETFNGSISFNTRGEVVYYEPTPNGSLQASTTSVADCPCKGISGVFANCTQPAIKAYFSINYVPTKLSELTNDTDFIDSVDLADGISAHNASTEAHPYIQSVIADTTEALTVSIQAETTARIDAVSLAISTTEAYADSIVSAATTATEAYTDSVLQSATTAINTTIGDLENLDTSVKSSVVNAINSEVSDRQGADNNLQGQIDALAAASDVTDIVGTYAELQAYDTQHLNNNDIIKVLSDETHDDEPSYYRFNKTAGTFSYIGSESAAYTKAQSDSIFVTKTTTVNNKALSSDITLTYSDVSALPATTTINDLTTTAQQNAINSTATTAKINQIATNTTNIASNTSAISTINGKIPTDASTTNKLVSASALAASIADFANKDLNNLSTTGTQKLRSLNAYANEGELLTDPDGLAFVEKYAHSTFDRSKFTVEGTPNITDDGIASNGDYQNYITTNTTLDLTNKTCVIKGSFTINALQPPTYTQPLSGSALLFYQYMSGQNKSILQLKIGGVWSSGLTVTSSMVGIPIYYELIIDNNNNSSASCSFIQNGVNIGTLLCENITPLTTDTTFEFYKNGGASGRGYVTIDLKQFSITVDGVEVFSGNKTGVDTIKPDDYTVVGSPTISADGVASGFSNGNYLTKSISVSNINKITLKGRATYQSNSTIISGVGIYSTPRLFIMDNGNVRLYCYDGTVIGAPEVTASDVPVSIEEYFYYECEISNSKRVLKLSADGNNWVTETSTNSLSLNLSSIISTLYIGYYYNGATTGSIDLNAFKLYADDILIYQPCLKIPYTESKTGSKIVNSIYRDRVNDMADQFGYANYYTLSDTDFTLPQGEVYGLIEKLSNRPDYDSTITISDINGSSKAYTIGAKCLGIIKPSTPASTYTISVQPAYGSAYKSISGYGYMTLEFDSGDKVYASVASSMDVYLIR